MYGRIRFYLIAIDAMNCLFKNHRFYPLHTYPIWKVLSIYKFIPILVYYANRIRNAIISAKSAIASVRANPRMA